MKYLLLILGGFIGTPLAIGAIQEDIIELDKRFIPVWYYASKMDLENAVAANQLLQAEWNHFSSNYQSLETADRLWKESFDLIGAWINESNKALKDGNIQLAFVQLDHVKYEWINFKLQFGFNYFLDDLYDLHESIAWVREIVLDDKLCLLEWNELEFLVQTVIQNWDSFDPVTHEDLEMVKINNREEVDEKSKQIMIALSKLQKATDTADQCQVQDVALPAEMAALELIRCFGNFELDAFKL